MAQSPRQDLALVTGPMAAYSARARCARSSLCLRGFATLFCLFGIEKTSRFGPYCGGSDLLGILAIVVSRSGNLVHALSSLAVCGALLLACVPFRACAEAVQSPRAPILRARLNSDIVSTDPGTRRDENTNGVLLHIVEGLVGSREDGSVGPMLASRWSISPDGRVYTFALRPEVVFHNGAPLTSAEVVWSLQRYLKPETRWRCLEVFGPNGIARVQSVKASDTHTVEVTLDRAAPMFLTTLARADCGATGIMHPDSVGADGSWIAPIGTGPFQIGRVASQPVRAAQAFSALCRSPGPPGWQHRGKACPGR